jgi:hypothetical protein
MGIEVETVAEEVEVSPRRVDGLTRMGEGSGEYGNEEDMRLDRI